jgi:hypothetical protein
MPVRTAAPHQARIEARGGAPAETPLNRGTILIVELIPNSCR